jgi:hypothetical protein
MTDEEALKTHEMMQEIFGDDLPDPEVYPRQFHYFVKLYRYYHVRQRTENSNSNL